MGKESTKESTFDYCQEVLKELRAAEQDPWADADAYYYIGIAIGLAEALQETTGYGIR
jgi:hypothetical protein